MARYEHKPNARREESRRVVREIEDARTIRALADAVRRLADRVEALERKGERR